MTKSIFSLIPEAEDLLALEPEEIGGVILTHIHSLDPSAKASLNRYNFSLIYTYKEYPESYHDRIASILMEGWLWLEREGFLAPKPGSDGSWFFITRRGMKASEALRGIKQSIPLQSNQ